MIGLKLSSSSKLTYKGRNNCFSIDPCRTCLGKTQACVDCYAFKGRHVFDSVKNRRINNTDIIIQSIDNPTAIENELYNIVSKNKNPFFRIHEAGDFFSQIYIDIWNNVIQSIPDKKFWAYTRSFNLDYSKIVNNKNMKLYTSIDRYNYSKAVEFSKRFNTLLAYGPAEENDPYKNILQEHGFVICPSILDHESKCEQCKICINGKNNVIFPKH